MDATGDAGPEGLRLPWGGDTLELRPEGAVFLPAHGALLVADMHLGKAHSFRRLGVPVPAGTTQDTLSRLEGLVTRLPVRQLVFLGDFLHSARSQASPALAAFADWRHCHPTLALTLVRGNHDDHAGDPPAALGMQVVDEPWRLGVLALCHHPLARPEAPVLAGHLHPGASVHGRARDRLRLPCFQLAARMAVLPAFGAFTGMHLVGRQAGVRRYAVDGSRVWPLDD